MTKRCLITIGQPRAAKQMRKIFRVRRTENAEDIVVRWCRIASSSYNAETRACRLYHPLEAAVRFGTVEDVAVILEHGRECALRLAAATNEDGDVADDAKHLELCGYDERLMEGIHFETALFTSNCGSIVGEAVERNDVAMVQYLLSQGARPQPDHFALRETGKRSRIVMPPLHVAIDARNVTMVRVLLDAGADVNFVYAAGGPPALQYAAQNENIEIMRLLLDRGARVDTREDDGTLGPTALYYAARIGPLDMVRLLLDRGADINANHEFPSTVLIQAASNECPYFYAPPEWIEELIQRGADIELADAHTGRTPLIHAAMSGNFHAVRVLLAARANVAATDKESKTALMHASCRGWNEIVDLLR